MSDEVFISIDSGTSMVKAIAIDANYDLLAISAVPNSYNNLPNGGAEQDLAITWESAAKVLKDVASQIPNIDKRLVAIGVTGQGDGTWLIDKQGKPVGDGLIWLDVRAADIVLAAEKSGARQTLYKHTGCGLNACNQSAQFAWLKENEPERIANSAHAFHCKDWLYYNLTGEIVTDISEAVFTFGDIKTRGYEDEIFDALDIQDCRHLLPEIIDGSQTYHKLTDDAAKLTGLPAGTPVSLGNVDVVCSAMGGGVYDPTKNVGVSIIGSTGMHVRFIESIDDLDLPDEPSGYTMLVSGFPTSLLRMQSNMSATLNIDWLVKIYSETAKVFGTEVTKDEVIAKLDDLASEPTKTIFHPYIQAGERGPFFNPNAKAQFTGIDFSTGINDITRAVFEGLAYAGRHCYEATGKVPNELRLIGGGAKSKTMRQTLANVLNASVRVSKMEEASAIGVMMSAAVAVGHFPDMATACSKCVDPKLDNPLGPQDNLVEQANRGYEAYLESVDKSETVWSKLADI